MLTDLHAGVLHAGEDAIARWVQRMNAEAPDLVLLGGDFTDAHWLFGGRLSPERIAERLAALEAPLGRVAVLGNHDWKAFGLHMWTALAGAGIPVLENDVGRARRARRALPRRRAGRRALPPPERRPRARRRPGRTSP